MAEIVLLAAGAQEQILNSIAAALLRQTSFVKCFILCTKTV